MKEIAFLPVLFTAFTFAAASGAVAEPVDYIILNASSIPASLTEAPGESAKGPDIFKAAGCTECHGAPGIGDASAIGPDLTDTATRLTPGEIRLMIVAPDVVVPKTEMPAYYSVGIFGEAPEDLVGQTRLSAGEIEALVAWLSAPGN